MDAEEYRKMFLFEDFYWWYKGCHRILLNQLDRYADKSGNLNILDAGCGTGKVSELLNAYGNVKSLDVSEEALEFARLRNGKSELIKGDVRSLPFDDAAFDCIVTLDVLCTLEDETKALKEFSRTLKKSGLLIANLPACEWLYSSHDIAVDTKKRYSKQMVRKLLLENGFLIKRLAYWNFFLFFIAAFVRIANKFSARGHFSSDLRSLPRPLNTLLTGLVYMEARLMNILDFPFGLSLFVVAEKA